MREAYASTEEEIWGPKYIRMPKEEYFELLDTKTVLVAFWDNVIVGSIRYYRKNDDTFGFGLLCTDPEYKRRGIGQTMIERVEEIAKTEGASRVELEILRVQDFDTDVKLMLAAWYERLGYKYTHSDDFANYNAEKAKLLARPSNFDYYSKDL